MTITNEYATELLSLKTEIISLKTIITTAVEQIKAAFALVTATPRSPTSNDMDTEVERSPEPANKTQTPIDLPALINDLKQEIATVVKETRALISTPPSTLPPFNCPQCRRQSQC